MNAVDTNVLRYAVDEDEPAKRKRAREFLRQLGRTDEPLLMWQVLGEFLAGLRPTPKTVQGHSVVLNRSR